MSFDLADLVRTVSGLGQAGRGVVAAVLFGGALAVSVAAVGSAIGQTQSSTDSIISLTVPRVIVLKSRRLVYLFDGDRLVRTYAADLGTSPIGPKRRQGDGRTPEGSFHIVTKNADSPYHRFLGIDYPDLPTVEWGLTKGLISPGEAASLRNALAIGRCPDWGTALGGGIGIHGRRMGRDWTGGCIALSDRDIEELFTVLRIGDPVEVLP